MRYQQGAILVFFTSAMLLVALGFSLSLYDGHLRQFKSINNEVEYRKKFWIAEGGLECAMGQLSGKVSFPDNGVMHNCGLSPLLRITYQRVGENEYQLESHIGSVKLSRLFFIVALPDHKAEWIAGSWRDW